MQPFTKLNSLQHRGKTFNEKRSAHYSKTGLCSLTTIWFGYVPGVTRPNLFASWHFYENEQSYTPIQPGPVAIVDSSNYYKVSPKHQTKPDSVAIVDSANIIRVVLHIKQSLSLWQLWTTAITARLVLSKYTVQPAPEA
jgi:hypothetical protein